MHEVKIFVQTLSFQYEEEDLTIFVDGIIH
jgi:hypothetical protein